MKYYTLLLLALGVLVSVPAVSSAALYQYIDIEGEVHTVEAASGAHAIAVAEADGNVLRSGVKVYTGLVEEGEVHATLFQYQRTTGGTGTVMAASQDAAYLLAADIVPGTLVPVRAYVGE